MSEHVDHRGITFISGFLGDQEDWDEVIAHLGDFSTSQKAVVGYSMGGRIALQQNFDKAVVFSSHMGLKTDEEKQRRWEEDLKWIELLKTKPLIVFLNLWYAQPLFATLDIEKILPRRLKQDPKKLAIQLEQYSLAKQPFHIPKNALFVCGEKDLKYLELYRKVLPQEQYKIIKGCGHALHLENPKACAKIIKEFL